MRRGPPLRPTPEENARMDQLIDKEVEEAFFFAEESPFPNPEEAYHNLYASKGS